VKKVDRSFCIVPVDRPLQLFQGRRAIALFGIAPVDRPLRLFHGWRAIALFASCRSIAFYYFFAGDGRSLFLASKGRSPFTTFSRATGDRSFWYEKGDRL